MLLLQHPAIFALTLVCGCLALCPSLSAANGACLALPCELNHGCDCDHDRAFVSPYDNQNYAVCASCDDGWTGNACNQRIASCANGGTLRTQNTSSPDQKAKVCQCPPDWTGSACTERQCRNAIGGTGEYRIRSPNATDNRCGGLCLPGYHGVQCQLCSSTAVHNKGASPCGNGSTCDGSLIPPAAVARGEVAGRKTLQCSIGEHSPFLPLLGGGRHGVGGISTIQCDFRPSTAQQAQRKTTATEEEEKNTDAEGIPSGNYSFGSEATCELQFYRVEPNATWTDAFFFCSLSNCTARTHIVPGITPSWADIPGRDSHSRTVARAFLLLSAFVLFGVHIVFPAPSRWKLRIVKATATVLVLVLLVVVLVFGANANPLSWRVTAELFHWNASETGAVARVTYDCPNSACRCADTPASGPGRTFGPHCIGSFFGEKLLPTFVHGASVDCNAHTGDCVFDQYDLNSPIALSCTSGDCVGGRSASSDRGTNVIPGAKVADVAPHDRLNRRRLAMALTWFALLAILVVVIGHWYYSSANAKAAALEFHLRYMQPCRLEDGEGGDLASERGSVRSWRRGIAGERVEDPDLGRRTDVRDGVATPSTGSDDGDNEAAPLVATSSAPTTHDAKGGRDVPAPFPESNSLEQGSTLSSRATRHAEWTLEVDRLSYEVLCGGTEGATNARDADPLGPRPPRPPWWESLLDPPRKVVLDQVSFTARSGECVALMGASGAGKTSLLDLLAARDKSGMVRGRLALAGEPLLDVDPAVPHASVPARDAANVSWVTAAVAGATGAFEPILPGGSFWRQRRRRPRHGALDGQDMLDSAQVSPLNAARTAVQRAHRVRRYRSLIGYVAQEDTLLPTLTVRQTLTFAAQLRLPAALSTDAVADVVEQCIAALGLAKCSDTVIGGGNGVRGLSGGERRRVSIGVELVGLPRILFLDEPTSGLDSENAARVMRCVAALARPDRREVAAAEDPPSDQTSEDERDALGHKAEDAEPAPFSPAALRKVVGRYGTEAPPIILFSIHQPSADIYALFDQVLLLDRGRVLYHGDALAAMGTVRRSLTSMAEHVDAQQREVAHDELLRGASSLARTPSVGSETEFDVDPSQPLPASMVDHLVDQPTVPPVATGDGNRRPPSNRSMMAATAAAAAAHQASLRADAMLLGRLTKGYFHNPAEFLLCVSAGLHRAFREELIATQERRREQQTGPLANTPPQGSIPPPRQRVHEEESSAGGFSRYAQMRLQYRGSVWQQLAVLVRRCAWSLFGGYPLIAAHAMVVFAVGLMLSELYHAEKLDLPGTLNRAGSLAFLQLVLAFSSLSTLEAALAEKKLVALEMEASRYTAFPVVLSRLVLFDLIPLRVLPTMMIASVIYAPMGLRIDSGTFFLWYLAILALFSCTTTMLTFSIGLVTNSLGAASLASAVIILWNFVFGGLLVQSKTVPSYLSPFRQVSPFFLSFEALLVNELDGQTCTFAPTDAAGEPSKSPIPLYCVQYLYNMGLDPLGFSRDVILLALWVVVLFFVVWGLVGRLRFER